MPDEAGMICPCLLKSDKNFRDPICGHTVLLYCIDISEDILYFWNMYLRTTQRKNKNGTWVKYYQLAHNKRHPETKKTIARIVHNFGRADRLDRNELVRLCRSIGRVCGLRIIDVTEDTFTKETRFGFSSEFKTDIPSLNHTAFFTHIIEKQNQIIDELEKTVAQLQESEEKYRTIFDNANDEIVYLDIDGTILEVNDKVKDIFGYKR